MQFNVLGPLEVIDGARPLEITAPKQRALLAVLLLSANRVVSGDRLLDELWGEQPPTGGLNTLKYHVSKLRDALQPGRQPGEEGILVTRSPGYALLVDPAHVDAYRFERMVNEARSRLTSDPAAASTLLDEALALWRGQALADFQGDPFAEIEILHLDELRLTALEDRIEADLALGRHTELIDQLKTMVAEHPLRERIWGQLMVAYYRNDRQAEALRTYQELRGRLGEELGIEPSPELAALEERILFQDPDLKQPGAVQPPGGRLRGYELRDKLGSGAFGIVWRAVQPAVGRDVAIKVIKPEFADRPDFVHRFEVEAKLVASLEHPHIVPIFDFWRDPDGAYLVMRLMPSGGLDHSPAAPWTPARALVAIEQIGSGLAYAHRRGLHHADLHPGNVLLDTEGNAYLADFGLAASLTIGSSTPPGGYASPEQRRGEPPTPATDIYGLATLTFRLLAGIDPPGGPMPSIQTLRPELPVEVETVLRTATDQEPAHRFATVDEFLEALRTAVGRTPLEPRLEVRNPYKGLRAFDEADALDFFSRNAEIAELLRAVAEHRLVGVVGPSGSGKSSLVRAGLIPALRTGGIPASEHWLITDMFPGDDPFGELRDALLRVATNRPPNLAERLGDPAAITGAIREALPTDAELLVIVDQFEELFTQCPDDTIRQRFMDALKSLASDLDSPARIVVTVRADFYGQPLEYQPFGDQLRDAVISITPPGPDELVDAITGPANRVGIDLDPNLADLVVNDVSTEPGGLPLMEYALTQLFEQHFGRHLTVEAYLRSGGVTGALANWSEQLYEGLDVPAKDAARQVFLRLVSVDESGQDTRRRVPLPELTQLGIDRDAVTRVLDTFGAARLLTFDRDPQTRTPTVEVAHEALIQRWERLGSWIEDRREDLVLQRRLRTAHLEWEDAERDEAYLLQRGRLHQFAALTADTDLAFTDAERAFLEASTAQERELTGRRRRRNRIIAAGLISLAAIASVFGIIAMGQRNRANEQAALAEQQAALAVQNAQLAATQTDLASEQADLAQQKEQLAVGEAARAETEERIATVRGLAASAVAGLDIDPELSLLLAIKSVEVTKEADGTVLREAEEALHQTLTAHRLVSVTSSEMWGRDLVFSPDDSVLYVGGFTESQIVSVPGGNIGASMPAIAAVDVAGPNGEWLVVGGFGGRLGVFDRVSLEELFVLDEGSGAWLTDIDVSTDGNVAAVASPYEGMAYVWNLSDRTQVASFDLGCDPGDCPRSVLLSDDGSTLLAGAIAWDIATGDRSDAPGTFAELGGSVALLDAHRAVVADESLIRILDLDTNIVTNTLYGHQAQVLSVDTSSDGGLIAAGSRDGVARVWKADQGGIRSLLTLPGHVGPVWKVQFSHDGRYLATISGSQEWPQDVVVTWPRHWQVRIWDIGFPGSHEWTTVAARPSPVSFGNDPSGALVVVGLDPDLGASMWDATTGSLVRSFPPPVPGGEVTAAAISPDGKLVAIAGTAADGGWCAVADAAGGGPVYEVMAPMSGFDPHDVAFSPDGHKLALAAGSSLQVWDTATWDSVLASQNEDGAQAYGSVSFSPDNTLLATQGFASDAPEPVAAVWDLETAEQRSMLGHFPGAGWGDAVFSPDGRMVVTAGIARPIIFEPFTGRQLGTLEGPAANAIDVAFSPDGSLIATAEGDGTVRLWDATTAEEQLVLRGHTEQVDAVAFSPDGTRLASASSDGELRVWALDIDNLLELAQSRVTRELTDAECRRYVGVGCPPPPAVERLVPAQSEAAGPIGITKAAWAAAPPAGSWGQLDASAPDGDPLLYDTDAQTLVAVNLNGPYVFDPNTGVWHQGSAAPPVPEDIAAEIGNPEASWGGAAYHPELDKVVVVRTDDGATLTYDVETDQWQVAAGEGPFATRYGLGMVYDTESDVLVSFGGAEWGRIENGKHQGLADTWIYDSDTDSWVDRTATASPPGRIGHGIVYDSAADRIIVFGGSTGFGVGEVLGDTWVYDTNKNTWTEMKPAVSPPARAYAAMWYDPVADLTFLFGGTEDTAATSLPWKVFGAGELWAYDYEANTWALYRTDGGPGYWLYGFAVLDPDSGHAVIIGGDWYDIDRRYQGENTTVWTFRFEQP